MKAIVFDTGPLISLSVNSLLWILFPLKKRFSGKFFITPQVMFELINKPLHGKKYQFEALRIQDMINEDILEVYRNDEITKKSKELMDLANSCFMVNSNYLKIVQQAEMETIAAALVLEAESVIIDERTTRLMIEKPDIMEKILEHKLNADVKVNEKNLTDFSEQVKKLKVLRSVELVIAAYRLGYLDRYVTAHEKVDKKMKNILLESVLWALKLYGCAVSSKEIVQMVRLEK